MNDEISLEKDKNTNTTKDNNILHVFSKSKTLDTLENSEISNTSEISEKTEKEKDTNHWELLKHYLQPISHFLQTSDITEICIDRFDEIYIERNGKLIKTDSRFESEENLKRLIMQIGILLDQPVDERKHPILDGRLPTGERINAVLYPIATKGHCMTIRCFPKCQLKPHNLLENNTLTEKMLKYLKTVIESYANILICGATGSGKTTLLNILSNYIDKKDRVVVVEDTQELQVNTSSTIFMETPHRSYSQDNSNNSGNREIQEITMSSMIKNALRQRPTRILVGEIRTPNAAEAFLTALNTGHKGSISTIHANNCRDAILRLEGLVAASKNFPFDFIRQQVRNNIDVIVYQSKIQNLGYRVTEIFEINEKKIQPIFIFKKTKTENSGNLKNPKNQRDQNNKQYSSFIKKSRFYN